MSEPFYRMEAPIEWAREVPTLSFSALRTLERCPRQWQLTRSKWEGLDRFPTRYQAAALEGTLTHEILDGLFRALALEGLPRMGTPAFTAVVQRFDVRARIQRAIDGALELVAKHPRRAAFRGLHDSATIYNQIARLFQQEYAGRDARALTAPARARSSPTAPASLLQRLRARGVLTEQRVAHPTLPLTGVIDCLRDGDDGTEIDDFKTGKMKPEYEEQLLLYALLWWRSTGDLPTRLSVVQPSGRTPFSISQPRAEALERELEGRIERARRATAEAPAPALLGEHCTGCDVRAFCDRYWSEGAGSAAPIDAHRRRFDAEVVVPAQRHSLGFEAEARGRHLKIVWGNDGEAMHGPFVAGTTARILGGVAEGEELRLDAFSEVFHRA